MFDFNIDENKDISLCVVPDCQSKRSKKGLCNAHYIRLRRRGTLERARKDWSNATPEEISERNKQWARADYEKNSQAYKDRALKWQTENEDHYRKVKREYLSKDDVKIAARNRSIQWRKDNPDKKKEMDKAFYEANRGLVNSYKAARRARVRQAIAPWMTDGERKQIADLFVECKKISDETGIPHQVDHIIPLAGKYVSGLHTISNLRIITAEANNKRPRIFNPI